MNTKEMTREQISALADGELADQYVDMTLTALRQEKGRADWDIYHQIGDVLRSDDMAVSLSPDFAARMAARLDAEPAIIAAPEKIVRDHVNIARQAQGMPKTAASSQAKRWALPSAAAAAAMAAVAFVATPQMMVAMKGETTVAPATTLTAVSGAEQGPVVATSAPEGVVLRDPRIDDYLMAHQRVSPSVYSTAQFARSATFATDSNK